MPRCDNWPFLLAIKRDGWMLFVTSEIFFFTLTKAMNRCRCLTRVERDLLCKGMNRHGVLLDLAKGSNFCSENLQLLLWCGVY